MRNPEKTGKIKFLFNITLCLKVIKKSYLYIFGTVKGSVVRSVMLLVMRSDLESAMRLVMGSVMRLVMGYWVGLGLVSTCHKVS